MNFEGELPFEILPLTTSLFSPIYDAIILDLMLPEMSGYDVLLKLRENKEA